MTIKWNSILRKKNPHFRNCGVTLVELILVILILSIISVGAIGYQYFGTRLSLRADAEMTATRTARLILDNWKKTGGDENFDLEDLDVGFVKTADGTHYKITVNGVVFTAGLQWQDVETDAIAGVGLRQLEVTLQWRKDFGDDDVTATDPLYVTVTYVRRDESGG